MTASADADADTSADDGPGEDRPVRGRKLDLLAVCGAAPAVYLLLATHLIVLPIVAPWHDEQRILQIVLFAGYAVVLTASRRVREEVAATLLRIPRAARGALAAVAVIGVASGAMAAVPGAAARDIAMYLLLFLTVLVVASARYRLGTALDRSILVIILVTAVLYAAGTLGLRVAGVGAPQASGIGVDMYSFSNPRFFALYATWMFPLVVALPTALDDGSRAARFILASVGVLWWVLLLEAGGRGAVLASVGAVLVAVVVLRRRALRWAGYAVAAIVIGSLVWAAGTALLASTDETASTAVELALQRGLDDNNRFEFWRQAAEMIRSSPVLGVGPENYAYHQQGGIAAHPHNAALQVASEWGVIALLVLVGLALWAMVAWIRTAAARPPGPERATGVALTASVFAAGGLAMLDGVIVMPVSQVAGALVIGLALGTHQAASDRTAIHSGQKIQAAVTGCAVALVAVLITTASPYLWSPRDTLEDKLAENEDVWYITPRFWVWGRLDR